MFPAVKMQPLQSRHYEVVISFIHMVSEDITSSLTSLWTFMFFLCVYLLCFALIPTTDYKYFQLD